jgi:hypothetical protein
MADEAPLDPSLAAALDPSVVSALAQWQSDTGNLLALDRWMTAGNTRAVVAVVVATGPEPPQKVILKACPPDRLTSREPRLHSRALSDSPPEFAERHLVAQPFETIECADKWRVLFQSIGGDSLQLVRPLDSVLRDGRLPEMVGAVVSSLLRDWNPTFATRQVDPATLLRDELGSKVDNNGPLVELARDLRVQQSRWVRFGDDPSVVVPNAVAWALDPSLWPADRGSLWGCFGRTHGDLHPGNVLIRVAPSPNADDYRLIDLSAFSADGSLAKDIAHLLLAIVAEQLTEQPDRRRQLLSIALGDDSPVPLELRGIREAADSVRAAAGEWLSTMGGMADDWGAQWGLALVTGGLEFAGRKSLPTAKRLWCFELACRALDRLLATRTAEDKPADPADVRLIGRVVDSALEAATTQILESCGRFRGTHVVVAVLSPSLGADMNQHAGDSILSLTPPREP